MVRRNIKGRKPRRRNRKTKLSIYFILFTILLTIATFYTYEYIDDKMMPILMAMGGMKVQTIATQSINEAIRKTLEDDNIDTDKLVTYYYNSEGEIISCSIDTIMINKICSDVINKLTNEIDMYTNQTMSIPIGNLVGGKIFANTGPNIDLKILPFGTAKINYQREFRSTGINQINHRVWLNVETTMQVVVPLASEKFTVTQQVTLVDRVLSGEVPPNYVNVPEESILDVTPDKDLN